MKRNLFFILAITISIQTYSQQKELPQGWDLVILEGKQAYMNLITGDIITTYPRKEALKKKKVAEYDPTQNHIVKKGETLSSIARKYNLTLAQIYRLNNVENFDSIKIGQEIVVGYQEENSLSTDENSFNNNSYHNVVAGETLYRIAKNYNLTVSKLKSLNGLDTNIISIGQQLKVQ